MIIRLECVWCTTRTEFNRYNRSDGEGAHVINYMDIVTKLSKADPYSSEPSHKIVGLHLRNALQNYVSGVQAGSNSSRLIYVLKNLTPDTVDGVFGSVQGMSDELKLCTKLVIINREDYPKKGVLSRFDVVKFIDK